MKINTNKNSNVCFAIKISILSKSAQFHKNTLNSGTYFIILIIITLNYTLLSL